MRKKEGPMRYTETAQKMIFYSRTLIGNREAIEAKKEILSKQNKKQVERKEKKLFFFNKNGETRKNKNIKHVLGIELVTVPYDVRCTTCGTLHQ